jgi:gliding motility-associated-like protein
MVARNGNCCGTTAPDKCINFIITLDPSAVGISFNIIAGAVPGGALFYQIGCGPPTPLGQPICLSGPGPHLLTFCKPGNNENIYQITSIPPAIGGTNIVVNDGCTDTLHATGFTPSTVTWNSIFPGAPGAYNSLLSCTSGCLNPIVTGAGSLPPYIDYVVCGQPAAMCNFATVCDTVRVTFNPTLFVSIAPLNPTICFGQTSTVITATGIGGTPPYSYLWNSINPSSSINVGAGTYTVMLTDNSGCPPAYSTVTVTSFSVAISANAGPNDTVCSQSPVATLNGSVTGASGGIWSGGSGTFGPNNTTLNATYSPSPAELAAGFVDLTLTTTGNGTCPAASDVVRINFIGFIGTTTVTPTNVSCFGGNNGSATVNISGGIPPYTYLWNTVPAQTGATANNLTQGTYSVTITNGIGCTFQTSVTITQPPPLSVSGVISNVSCAAGNNGSVSVTPSGGTAPYTYLWAPGGQTTSSISGQIAGTYTVTVTDSKGCILTSNYTITQPLPVAITLSHTNVSCFNGSNGTATASVTGGTSPYTYSWSPSGGTAATASGLAAGTYTVTVTDSKGCTALSSVTITQPTALAATTTVSNETCDYLNNGTAAANPAGGTPGYTYLWMPGGATSASVSALSSGTYTLTVTDANGCAVTTFAVITQPLPLIVNMTNQVNVSCFAGNDGSVMAAPSGGTGTYTYLWSPGGSTSQTLSGAAAGTYTVIVTDINGCQAQNQATITQPALPLSVSNVTSNVSCPGGSNGSVTVTPAGGTAPYTYLWTPGGQTTQTISGQIAGTYTVTVTDSKGCIITSNYTITQPLPIAITFNQTNVSCFNGSNGTATANVTGGTSAYTYNWSPSGGTAVTASGLAAGTYTVTVTDANGCTALNSVTITQPTPLTVSTTVSNETCDYLNNGAATANPSGGTPGYTYLWLPGGSTSASVSALSSGTYTLTVTDANGCVALATAVITEPAPLAITFSSAVNVSCFGGSNGSVSATPSGGTPNYSYLWTPGGSTTNSISGLTAGTYTLMITDNNGCQEQNTITITQPTAPLTVSGSSTPASCFGASNGTATAAAAGGTSAYSYSWMPGSLTGSNVTGLTAGVYTVTVTDANLCSATNTITVNQPAEMILTTNTANSNCGTPSGQASVTVSGGIPGYTYSWSPSGGTAATATGLLSGAYTVSVTDANGCVASQWANVNDNAGPNATIFSIINVTCFGGSDGAASVGVSGGTGPFTYNWTPYGGTTTTATGLVAGTYTVTVLDANGCQSLATTSPDIMQPPPITISVNTTAVSCFGGSNGTATAIVSGGTPGYNYLWNPGASAGITTGGLAAGGYTLQVTDSNSCVQTFPFNVTQPASALSVALSSDSVSCFGGSDGSANAIAAGGTGPYNYTWMPGSISGQTISLLPAGTYTVNTSDANGCTTSGSIIIDQTTPLILTAGSDNASCGAASGVAYVSSSGGTSPYTYLWSPSGITNDTASSVFPGTYTVVVTDDHSCTSTASINVNNNPGPSISITSTTNVSCNGGSDGTANSAISGGAAPFVYSWSPLGGSGSSASGLPAGTYTVSVTDNNGCIAADTTDTPITEPLPIIILVTTDPVNCNGGSDGSAAATALGGTPGFTYLWQPSGSTGSGVSSLSQGTYTVQATDANSCIQTNTFVINEPSVVTASISSSTNVSCFGGNDGTASVSAAGGTPFYTYNWLPSGGTNQTAVGLSAGSYTVTVTDINGCSTTASITISQPAQALSASATGTPTSCFAGSDGTASVTAIGGTPAYAYNWSPIGGTGPNASGLSPGNYTVLVTDDNGCQANASVTITQPAAITASLSTVDPSCGSMNGSITSMVSGGTGTYTYLWSPGSATSADISGVGPGSYNVQITDANNCAITVSATLTNIAGPGASISAVTNVSCFGGNNGSATVSITSGTPPYVVSWSPYGGSGLTGTGFIAGSYTVTVSDDLGCIATATAVITEPPALGVTVSSLVPVSCNGGNNGSITVTGTGGTAPFSYSWSPIVSSSSTVSGLPAGTYTVSVTDQNSCSSSISVGVTQPATLSSAIGTSTGPVCFGSSNGSATVSVSGGTIPYSYLWNDGQTGSTAVNLIAGTYTVTVTDANNCTAISNVIITQPTQVITSAGNNDTICLGTSGTVTASASGGAGNYYFVWQPGPAVNSGTLNVTPTDNTEYIVVAYDEDGCAGSPDTVSAIVYELTGANVEAIAYSPICPGQSSPVYVQITGDTGPLTYSWNNGLGNGPGAYVVTPASPTTYIVTVTNSCGTSVIDSVDITFNPPPTIDLSSDTNAICVPGIVQFTDNSITGNLSDPITSWYWNFGDGTFSTLQNPSHVFPSPGTYPVTVTVTTSAGCTNNNASGPYYVNAYPYPIAAFSLNSTQLDLPYDVLIGTNLSVGASTYYWTFGDGGSSTEINPSYLYSSVGVYPVQLIATSTNGCSDTAYSEVTTNADVVFPNVFTPDENGPSGGFYDISSLTNDIFFPYTSGVVEFQLRIFNRWGELIFETFDVKQGWDGYYRGQLCQQDVYIWQASLKLNNGKTFNKTGDVTLLR